MKRKLISVILCVAMMAQLLPTVVRAEDKQSSIVFGTNAFQDRSMVYFGKYNNNPVRWWVLQSGNGNATGTNDRLNNGISDVPNNAAALLLSDSLLDSMKFHEVPAETPWLASNAWEGSTVKNWCTNFANSTSNFSPVENYAMLKTTKSDAAYSTSKYKYGTSSLNQEKAFFLSAEEASPLTSWILLKDKWWWLRSPSSEFKYSAGTVVHNQYLGGETIIVYNVCDRSSYSADPSVRPAFNLDRSSVLFMSDASGKASGNLGADALVNTSVSSVTEWKLTLKDTERKNFQASLNTDSSNTVEPGQKVKIRYSGAKTGDNEYVSAILVDGSNKIQYYGRIAHNSESAIEQEITIPVGLTPGNYKLKVFSELYNGEKLTDYASDFSDIPLTVKISSHYNTPAPIKKNGITATVTFDRESPQAPNTKVTATVTLSGTATAAGNHRIKLSSQKVMVSNSEQNMFVTAGQNLNGNNAVVRNFVFTVPTYAVDDLTLTHSFAPPNSSQCNIALGASFTSVIRDGNAMYFGKYNGNPIQWRVLRSTNGNATYYLDSLNNGAENVHNNTAAFLISEILLDTSDFQSNAAIPNADWADSNAKRWCTNFADSMTNFSSLEKALMLKATISAKSYSNNNIAYTESALDSEKAFLLSTGEIMNYMSGSKKAFDINNNASNWLLRSIKKENNSNVVIVDNNGAFSDIHKSASCSVRPAINLYKTPIFFLSAANGKASGNLGANALTDTVVSSVTTEWKLTLFDSERSSFQASLNANSSNTVDAGQKIKIDYSGAKEGSKEYVSAMIVDGSNNILYYGRIANNSASATEQEITIPTGLTPGNYTLKIFNEQYNGDKLTDYASTFKDILLTVTKPFYDVTYSLQNITTTGLDFVSKSDSTDYTATLEAVTGYTLPDSITVKVGDTELASGDYSYNSINGTLNIPRNKMNGDIEITAAAVSATYSITASPSAIDFKSASVGYPAAPEAQTVTIQNTGNQRVTLTQPSSPNYVIGTLSNTELKKGEEATFTVQPKIGLPLGSYNEPLQINGTDGATTNVSKEVSLTFAVTEVSITAIIATPNAINFDSRTVGYPAAPAMQTVTIQNTGNQSVTLATPSSTNYDIGTLSSKKLNTGENATFTVQPKTGLAVGTYNENLKINGTGGTSAAVSLTFTVAAKPSPGGNGNSSNSNSISNRRYTISRGIDSAWVRGSGMGLSATCEGEYSKFSDLWVDGRAIGTNKYSSQKGSTIITLKPEYLKTLSDGKHTLRFIYTDGDAQTSFTIKGNINIQTDVWNNPFLDVKENDWFYSSVGFIYLNKIMTGTASDRFSPHEATTRSMLVTMLYRMGGEPAAGNSPFTDVKAGTWYEKPVAWVSENKLVTGYDNGKFGPSDELKREQIAVILYNYAKLKGMDVSIGENTNILSYEDANSISAYAVPAMQWVCGAGILKGNNRKLLPQAALSRAEMAAILQRFMLRNKEIR